MGYTLQIPSQLPNHLRALRKAKGLTQAELGSRLGLSQARVARIEGEPLSISVEQLLRVLAALDVRVTLEPRLSHRALAKLDAPPVAVGASGGAGKPSAPTENPGEGEDW